MPAVENIFDPARYAAVRLPLLEASHLPPWCYTSQEFYDREVETIFMKTWTLVGRGDFIPSPGDYFTCELVGVSLIVVRDNEGVIRAFANTCRHRGAKLLDGKGSCKSIKCPYHSWVYGLDGELIGAPGMERTVNFDRSAHPLRSVRLDSWEGFLFVNLDPDGESLLDYLGDLPEQLATYKFSEMVCTRRQDYDVACNWKLFTENAMEEYHTSTVHRTSLGTQKILIEETRGEWMRGHLKSEKSIATLPGDTEAFPRIESLSGDAAEGTNFVLINPCTVMACQQDGMFMVELYPRAPTRSTLVLSSLFPKTTVARPDFDEVVQKYYYRLTVSIPEDIEISERQQSGLNSPLSDTSRISWHELAVHTIGNWVLDRVLGENGMR